MTCSGLTSGADRFEHSPLVVHWRFDRSLESEPVRKQKDDYTPRQEYKSREDINRFYHTHNTVANRFDIALVRSPMAECAPCGQHNGVYSGALPRRIRLSRLRIYAGAVSCK